MRLQNEDQSQQLKIKTHLKVNSQKTARKKTAPKKAKSGSISQEIYSHYLGNNYTDYSEKRSMITGFYYAKLLGRFDADLRNNGPYNGF